MPNNGCIDIVYRLWPERLEAWIRVEKKLQTIKEVCSSDPTEKVLESIFDPEEKEVLNNLLEYLVKEYEKKHGPLSYLLDKFGPSVLMLILREALGRLP